MEHKERNAEFREADRKYAELVSRRDAGEIGQQEFDAERKRLMVLDKEGRWWAKSSKTGEWNYHDGKSWVPGVPPGYQPEAGGASSEEEPTREQPASERKTEPVAPPGREVADGGERRRSGIPGKAALISAVLILVLLVGGAYVLSRGTGTPGAGGGDAVEAPDLVGASSVEEAQEMAGGGFEVVEGEAVESREPIGSVVSQDPAAGEQISEGATISVEVSKGVGVPDVEGNTRDEAVQTLREAGFGFGEKTKESSADDEGNVIGQNPEGGEYAEAGSTVEITVGEGPSEDDSSTDDGGSGGGGSSGGGSGLVPVPDVIGQYVGTAQQTLADAGFDFVVETLQSDQEAGTVVATDPAPGTPLDPASRAVVIVQSSGPPVVEEPPPVTEEPPPPPTEEIPPPPVEETPPPVEGAPPADGSSGATGG